MRNAFCVASEDLETRVRMQNHKLVNRKAPATGAVRFGINSKDRLHPASATVRKDFDNHTVNVGGLNDVDIF